MAHTETVIGAGEMRNGRLKIIRFPALDGLKDGPVDITVTRKRATRSAQANAYWWGVVLAALSEHTGYTRDEIHEIVKAKFLPRQLAVCDGNGEVIGEYVIGGTTTRLTTVEFGELIERVRVWAAEELGCEIPEPAAGA